MLVVHPASLCDVCLDPYTISSEPANSPHAIACGHIFCLPCLRSLSPSACPLCRKAFQPDRVKKLHVAGPPELDGAIEELIEEEATQLLQRVALVSGEDVPDVEIIEVVTLVEEWLANNAVEGDSHRPLRAALAALKRFKALQERNEREYAEFRRIRRELKAHRRSAHQDSKTSRAVEESLLERINEIENNHALEVSQDEQRFARCAHVFQLSQLHAELNSLRDEGHHSYRNTSNPLPPPPEPLPLDRFPPFARLGSTTQTSDRPPTAVPYPPPPPSAQTTSNGYSSATSYGGTTQYLPLAQITQPLAAPRARHAEVPRGDERSRRQEPNGMSHAQDERRPHAESSRAGASEARYANTEGRLKIATGPLLASRVVPASSPAPSWAHHPLVEGGRSDEEREFPRRPPTNAANGVLSRGSTADPRPSVGTRLVSAEAYVQGYGSGYDSGFQLAREPVSFTPSSYGSERSDRAHSFPVQESPDQPIGGLGLMGVPQPSAPGTVSTPDEDTTPVSRPRGLIRRNTTQAVDTERSARRSDGQSLPDIPQNGGVRRAPVQTLDRALGVRRTITEGGVQHGVNGNESLAGRHRTVNGGAAPSAGGNESPRSETTWGTVHTLSRGSVSEGSLGSLGLLLGLHNGGPRVQGTVTSEPYAGRESRGDGGTSEEGEEDVIETPMPSGSLPGSESDVSHLGLIMEEEGDYSGSRHRRGVEDTTSHRRSMSHTERIPHGLDAPHERQPPRARRSDGQRRHVSQSSIAEPLQPDTRNVVNPSDITSTNALSLHFDASFPAHDYQGHGLSPSGPEIIAPTPIVGGPNIIHLWANRV